MKPFYLTITAAPQTSHRKRRQYRFLVLAPTQDAVLDTFKATHQVAYLNDRDTVEIEPCDTVVHLVRHQLVRA